MNTREFVTSDERFVRTYDYDDRRVIVADLGTVGDADVDVVGETVIVVPAGDHEQFEVEVPTEGAQAFIKNGILTIKMEDEE